MRVKPWGGGGGEILDMMNYFAVGTSAPFGTGARTCRWSVCLYLVPEGYRAARKGKRGGQSISNRASKASKQAGLPPQTSPIHQHTAARSRQASPARPPWTTISPYMRYLNNHAIGALEVRNGACKHHGLEPLSLGMSIGGPRVVLHNCGRK